ncbi:MAG TPA: hypothetical protein VIU61_21945, partial [Kofleriaceae bacterium]
MVPAIILPEVWRERLPVAAFVALAITAIALSRIVLRSERQLATFVTGALPYLIAGLVAGIAVYVVMAARRRAVPALSA